MFLERLIEQLQLRSADICLKTKISNYSLGGEYDRLFIGRCVLNYDYNLVEAIV